MLGTVERVTSFNKSLESFIFSAELAQIPVMMEHLKDNYQYWKDQDELENNKTLMEDIIVEEIS